MRSEMVGSRLVKPKLLRRCFNKSGAFTLIELLIYLALFSFFAVLFFGFFLNVRQNLESAKKRNLEAIRVQVIFDLLKRDLLCASSAPSDWDFNQNVFKKNILNKNGDPAQICVGYVTDKKGVCRKEGFYDFKNNRWIQASYAHVGCEISDLKITERFGADSCVSGVNIEVLVNKRKISVFVCLRNRVVA